MHKIVIVLLSFLIFSAAAESSDIISVTAGAALWRSSSDINGSLSADSLTVNTGYAEVRHFLPLVPNLKLKYTGLDFESHGSGFHQVDVIGFYSIVDSSLATFDLGLTLQNISGDVADFELSEFQPGVYGRAEIRAGEDSAIAFYAEVTRGKWTDVQTAETDLGVALSLLKVSPVSLKLKAGYKELSHKLKGRRMGSDGFYLGADLNFGL